ncbi:MAG: signal peptide peptidase SppA [Kiritimatiellaeota bacterium]|nr:signal peptide peptidase SppA [Kiritimatiellota bacterium]
MRGCLFFILFLFIAVLSFGGYALYHTIRALGNLSIETGSGSTPLTEETLREDTGSDKKIVVIDVKGLIVSDARPRGVASAALIHRQLRTALKDRHTVAVILDMDTPGGEVTASDEIHNAVQRLRAAGKPVVTCMHTMGASGGYYVACGTDYIIANRLTLTGSVGVIITSFNYQSLFTKLGLRSDVYKSGAMKDILNGARQPTPEEQAYIQRLVDETFTEFAKVIAAGRGFGSVDAVLSAPFADGRVLSGRQALEYGLVDALGYFDDAVAKARDLGHAPRAKVVRYRRPSALLEMLLSEADGGWRSGVTALLPVTWRHVMPGRPYYLMRETLP